MAVDELGHIFDGMPKEKRDELFKELSDSSLDHSKELRETMRNIGIISAAVAVGALVLMGTNVPVDQSLILIGIITLLLEVVFVFGYLLQKHTSEIDDINEVLYGVLTPIGELSSFAEKDDTTDTIFAEKASAEVELMLKKLEKLLRKQPQKGRRDRPVVELLAFTLLFFGIVMIIFGLINHPLCATWKVLCF